MLQKEIKDFTFKIFYAYPLTFLKNYFVKTFMMFTWRGDGEFLKFVTWLQILLFLNNRSIVHFSRWGRGSVSGGGFVDVIIVWYLILKVNFDTLIKSNIYSFEAGVTVKQPFLVLNICTIKMKSNLKLYSSKYCHGEKLKPCQE